MVKYNENKIPKSVNAIFDIEHSPLTFLARKVTGLEQINQYIQGILPEELKQHAYVANVRGSTLIIALDSNHWMMRARFYQAEILRQCQAHQYSYLHEIKWIVTPGEKPEQNNHVAPELSKTSAGSIQQCARHINDDQLKAALERLAASKKS